MGVNMLIQMEIRKVIKNKGIIILSVGIPILIFLLYLNYTMNKNSVIFEPALLSVTNTISFFIALYCILLVNIWAAIVGSYVGNNDNINQTIYNYIGLRGRCIPYCAKLAALLFLNVVYTLILTCLPYMIAVVKLKEIKFDFVLIVTQAMFISVIGFSVSIIAYVISVIIKSETISNVIVIITFYIPMMLGGELFVKLKYFNPLYYFEGKLEVIFGNLEELEHFRINAGEFQQWHFIIGYLLIYIVLLFLVIKRRNYK